MNVEHRKDGSWHITNDRGTTMLVFSEDEYGLTIACIRTLGSEHLGIQPDGSLVMLNAEETALLKEYLLTPQEETAGGVLPGEGAGDA